MSYKEDEYGGRKRNYNNSTFHRDYNIIRCDHEKKTYNASDVAYRKTKQGQLNLENNWKKLRESLQITKERYRKAIENMNDEKVLFIWKLLQIIFNYCLLLFI